MSLDVYLEYRVTENAADAAKLLREHGFPVIASIVGDAPVSILRCAYSANITHNLNSMADAAGIYQYLWRPDEIGITTAKELIQPLREGLKELQQDQRRFMKFEPENKWGTYEGIVKFVTEYIEACEKYPSAKVRVSR